ncbi:MAG: MBL fold metallo-hydrolase [Gemmatimonadales bacterium]
MAARLHVLGSGSRGNCLALEWDGAVLLVDAGFSRREIERRAVEAGLDLDGLAGIVLTHEHGDHTGGLRQVLRKRPAPVFASPGTWAALNASLPPDTTHCAIGLAAPREAGPFRIEACPSIHDAAEPVAVVVTTPDGARIGVAYDLGRPTGAVRYLLREAAVLVLEANHDEILLRTSGYPPVVQQRIAGSGGHLSNRAAADLVRELLHPELEHVVLAHLSERCNTADHARLAVEPVLQRAGFQGRLHVARQDVGLPVIEVLGPRQARMF